LALKKHLEAAKRDLDSACCFDFLEYFSFSNGGFLHSKMGSAVLGSKKQKEMKSKKNEKL
jgi:hypothetical protein